MNVILQSRDRAACSDKTLYISDLDGTLLRLDETVSAFTAETVNRLEAEGILFSYATARSYLTASKVTAGITARLPVIVYNGAFIIDSGMRAILSSTYFTEAEAEEIEGILLRSQIFPLVYSILNEEEKFTYYEDCVTPGMRFFLDRRKTDTRRRPVPRTEPLRMGRVFYFSCIDSEEKLRPVYGMLKGRFHCIFQRDLYSGAQWLEILPEDATKAHAARRLKNLLGADRVVSFGDGKNDLPLFQASDACYAVANAVPELKKCATAVIGSNQEDGVAAWLRANVLAAEA